MSGIFVLERKYFDFKQAPKVLNRSCTKPIFEVSIDAHEVGEELPNNLLYRNTLWCRLLIRLGQNQKMARVNALKPRNFAQYNDTFCLNFKRVCITSIHNSNGNFKVLSPPLKFGFKANLRYTDTM